jgi:hypothetical protein
MGSADMASNGRMTTTLIMIIHQDHSYAHTRLHDSRIYSVWRGTLAFVCLLAFPSTPLHGFIHSHSLLFLQPTPPSLPDIRVSTSPISRNTDLTAHYSLPDLPFKIFPELPFLANSLQFHPIVFLRESRTRDHLDEEAKSDPEVRISPNIFLALSSDVPELCF